MRANLARSAVVCVIVVACQDASRAEDKPVREISEKGMEGIESARQMMIKRLKEEIAVASARGNGVQRKKLIADLRKVQGNSDWLPDLDLSSEAYVGAVGIADREMVVERVIGGHKLAVRGKVWVPYSVAGNIKYELRWRDFIVEGIDAAGMEQNSKIRLQGLFEVTAVKDDGNGSDAFTLTLVSRPEKKTKNGRTARKPKKAR